MIAILRQMDDSHYTHYINVFKTNQDISVSCLHGVLVTLRSLTFCKNSNQNWAPGVRGSLPIHLHASSFHVGATVMRKGKVLILSLWGRT